MNPEEKTSILIIDDSPQKITTLELILADMNLNIVSVNSGTDGLRKLLVQNYACILLDVNMPVMDGFETAIMIRKRPKSQTVPILFVTALNTADKDMQRGYSIGAVDYILTPIIPEVLRAKVNVFVELYEKTKLVEAQKESLEESYRKLADNVELIKGLNDRLLDINKELSAFSYSISHDLKAPLRGISGYSSELIKKHNPGLSERAAFCVSQINTASKQLSSMIDDLLTYSRLGLEAVGSRKINMKQLIESVLKQNQFKSDGESVILSLQLEEVELLCWETGMSMVINNLVDNAFKYSSKINPSKICINTEIVNSEFVFTISDNGIGFDMIYHERMFGLFNRLMNSSEYEGTGAGLAIVKKIIDKHNGRIWGESEPGKGAKFIFTVPVVEHG